MSDEQEPRTKLEARMIEARRRLTGREDAVRGLQVWFMDQVEEQTGWRPSTSSMHRYVIGERDPDERVLETLRALEEMEPLGERPDLLDELGAKRERNVLLLADWIRGRGTGEEIAERYGVSRQRVDQLVRAADVRRLEDVLS